MHIVVAAAVHPDPRLMMNAADAYSMCHSVAWLPREVKGDLVGEHCLCVSIEQ